jgi:hypothetical protein
MASSRSSGQFTKNLDEDVVLKDARYLFDGQRMILRKECETQIDITFVSVLARTKQPRNLLKQEMIDTYLADVYGKEN